MEVLRLFTESFKGGSGKFTGCFKSFSRKYQGCFKKVSRLFQIWVLPLKMRGGNNHHPVSENHDFSHPKFWWTQNQPVNTELSIVAQ